MEFLNSVILVQILHTISLFISKGFLSIFACLCVLYIYTYIYTYIYIYMCVCVCVCTHTSPHSRSL
jgi:hypothetical protein